MRSIPPALRNWLITAAILLPCAVLWIRTFGLGSRSLGYFSSAISFLCACMAGRAVREGNGRPGLIAYLALGLVLVIILLLSGLAIGGQPLEPSAVLSVASFSLAGCLFSSLFAGRKTHRKGSGPKTVSRNGRRFP